MNWWFVIGGVALSLSWLIKWWDRRQMRKRNERIWAMIPKHIQEEFRHGQRD